MAFGGKLRQGGNFDHFLGFENDLGGFYFSRRKKLFSGRWILRSDGAFNFKPHKECSGSTALCGILHCLIRYSKLCSVLRQPFLLESSDSFPLPVAEKFLATTAMHATRQVEKLGESFDLTNEAPVYFRLENIHLSG